MTGSDPIVRAEEVVVSPGERRVLDGLDFDLARGEAPSVIRIPAPQSRAENAR